MHQLEHLVDNLKSVSFSDISCIPYDKQHIVADKIEDLLDCLQTLFNNNPKES